MKRIVALLGAVALGIGVATAQGFNPWRGPAAEDASGAVLLCATGSGRNAVACGVTGAPLVTTAGGGTQAVSGTVSAAQSGTWRMSPTLGTPAASAVTSLGTTSTAVFAANSGRRAYLIQNPAKGAAGAANTADVWCNLAGAAAVAGPPSIHIPPGSIYEEGRDGAFVSATLIACIALAAATPLAGWQR